MYINSRTALGVFAILTALPAWGRPKTDKIVMDNGDRITCEVKKLERGVLYASLDYVDGIISVNWLKVARLESSQEFTVTTVSGSVYTGALKMPVNPADQPVKIDVIEASSQAVPLTKSQVAELDQTSANFWRRFGGNLSNGISYTRGNNSTQFNLNADLVYRRPSWLLTNKYSSTLSSNSGSSTSTRAQFDTQAVKLMRQPNWYYAGLLGLLKSSQQGIQLQSTFGGAIGHLFTNSSSSRTDVFVGAVWQGTTYNGTNTQLGYQRVVSGLVGTNLQVFRFKKTKLDMTATLLPAFSDPGRLRSNVDVTYKIQIFSNFWWNLILYSNWDSRPPAGLKGSDYGTSSGITYSFGK